MLFYFILFMLKDIFCSGGGFVMLVVDQCEVMCLMFVVVGQLKFIVDSVFIDFKVVVI